MQPPPVREVPALSAPRFTVIERQPFRPTAILLAVLTSAAALSLISFAWPTAGLAAFETVTELPARAAPETAASLRDEDEKDDPSQVDVITLGDAADAPMPAQRHDHGSGRVHPTIIVHLPRFGEQVGLIPDTVSGHLLYAWLAAFNQADLSAIERVLPNAEPSLTATAQMQLRRQTGGFNVLSARQVGPGVLVFRLRDQTPASTEVLGTLQVDTHTDPATIASISLRAVSPAGASTKP